MKTNHMTDPLGVWMTQPVFSWVTEDTPSKRQVSARVRISQDASMAQPCFDSGLGDWDSRAYQPDFTPAPRTRYYWQVTVTGDAGDSAEATAWFETGKQDEPWQAAWITPDAAPQTHPLLRRAFRTEDVTRARIYATGMGAYYLFLNGARVGDEYLAPGCNDYSSWVQVQAFDVTPLLRAGENVLGAMLGNSWAKGRFGLANEGNPLYCDRFALLCELHLTHADGTETVITSDDMWRWENGPVTDSSIYDGETYDARLRPEGWAAPGFDDTVWKPVVLWQSTLGPTRDRLSPPVKINRTFRPVEVIHTPAGETVLDLGQNIVGWLRMHVNAPTGTEISLWHGETLQQGNFYRDNLRSAKAEYHYISDGRPAEVQPWFTFFGFRYVKLEGWPGEPDLADFTACAVYSELEELGELETSHPLVNRLIQNALWSQRDNFLDVPTDCPQRDEREGWTGDAQVFSGTAMFNMDCTAFYLKYTYDMYMEQLKLDGCVPDVIPNVNRYQEGGRKPTGACAWADAATVIPWNTYVYSGDPDVLRRQLASMRAWVDYVTDFGVDVANSGGWLRMFHYGDWLALDGDGGPDGVMGGTEVAFLAAAYHVYSAELTARAARALGETEVAAQYQARADQIRTDMQHEYFTPGGRGALQTQTFYVVSLFMRICPEPAREKTIRALVDRLKADNMHLKTGFIGTPILCRVLSDNGYSDLAYQLLLNEDLPSWLYEVKMGATTIWERWNSINPDGSISSTGMNSLNHYSYGSVVEWMYRHMCGLKPCESDPGFKRASLRPEPNRRMRWVKMRYRSAMGLYRSEWRIADDGRLEYLLEIPFNAQAEVFLPDARVEKLEGAEGLGFVQCGTGVAAELPAGVYHIAYLPEKPYLTGRFTLDTPMGELLADERARAVVAAALPVAVAGEHEARMKSSSLNDLRSNPFAAMMFSGVDWDAVEKQLSAIR